MFQAFDQRRVVPVAATEGGAGAEHLLGDLIRTGEVLGDLYEVFKNYRKGITKGLLKILSKMGISTIASYRGAQLFEAIGLSEEICELSFRGVPSRIKGARFVDLEAEQKLLAAGAATTTSITSVVTTVSAGVVTAVSTTKRMSYLARISLMRGQ